MTRRWWIGWLLVLAATPNGWGHDFWLNATTFLPEPQQAVQMELFVGERFRGEPVALRREQIAEWHVGGPPGSLLPTEVRPGCWVRAPQEGSLVVGLETTTAYVSLPAHRFTRYLREEGLQHVLAQRARQGEEHVDVDEAYTRCAKALLTVENNAPSSTQPVGLPFEITPGTVLDATAKSAEFRLTYRGKPAADVLVVALHERGQRLTTRADTDGAVRFDVSRPGRWLLKAVHMVPGDKPGVDWHSYWASLSWQQVPQKR